MASQNNLQDTQGSTTSSEVRNRPTPAKISRERSLESTGGKYKLTGKSNTTKVALHDRCRQFPDEHFTVREGKLFCNACREILGTKKSVLQYHISSKKHQKGKDHLKKSKLKEQTIIEAFKAEKSTTKDSTLPLEERAYRIEVVGEFLKAGIPIRKIDALRPLLEKNGYRLTGSTHQGQYISSVLKHEIEQIKEELAMPGQIGLTRDLSIIFDGSTRQGEAIAIIVRFLDNNWMITQRLIRIDVCSKSVNADELAQVLNQCLAVDYGVRASSLLAAMRDGASVNQAALNKISFIFPKLLNVVCFSHTLDNVGNHLVIPTLLEFGSLWIRLFSQSYKAKLLWKDLTGQTPRSYSETRWWSKWEVYHQLLVQFGDIKKFLEEAIAVNVGPQLVPQIQAILSDPQRLISLKLELAITIDLGEHFVKTTYFLEGDGPLVFSCYEKLSAIARVCQAPHFPNVRAIAAAIAGQDPDQNAAALERRAKACVEPAIQWFLRKFNVDLYDILAAFKAARLMCPVNVQWLKPTPETVESLRAFPFLDNDVIMNGLKDELPIYMAAAEDVAISTEEKKVEWWYDHKEQLPYWATAVKQVLLVQPSSAAAERVFSLLKSSFNEQQGGALVDYLQASIMLQYNKR